LCIAGDEQIGTSLEERHAVERGVGFDETAMLLRLEQCENILDRRGQAFEPRRYFTQWPIEAGFLQHE